MPEQSVNSTGLGASMESEDAKEILGASPRWIVRWGNLIVLGNIILLLLLSIFIPFPEVIQGKVAITPAKKPFDLFIPAGAIPARILVSDHDTVKKGQALLYLSNASVMTAPVDGVVIFQRDMRTITDTTQKTCLMTIDPSGQRYNAIVTIGNTGSGKIQIGQQVVIQLDNYPSREFGNIIGTVISKPQYTGAYSSMVAVYLDRDVTTTYNKKLEIYVPAAGMAEIVTSNKKLIRQIFSFL